MMHHPTSPLAANKRVVREQTDQSLAKVVGPWMAGESPEKPARSTVNTLMSALARVPVRTIVTARIIAVGDELGERAMGIVVVFRI